MNKATDSLRIRHHKLDCDAGLVDADGVDGDAAGAGAVADAVEDERLHEERVRMDVVEEGHDELAGRLHGNHTQPAPLVKVKEEGREAVLEVGYCSRCGGVDGEGSLGPC